VVVNIRSNDLESTFHNQENIMNIRIAVLAALFAVAPLAQAEDFTPPMKINFGGGLSASTRVVQSMLSPTVQVGPITKGCVKAYKPHEVVGNTQSVGTDAGNLNPPNAVQPAAPSGIDTPNTDASGGDTIILRKAIADSQIIANVAQSNSYAYTNQKASATLGQADANAQGYASIAQNNAENFAQGAANRAQTQADHYAAAGIAAALAMPSSPYLRPGHYALGVQAGFYAGMTAVGGRATYQMSRHWSVNAGLSVGTGRYSNSAETVGFQWEN